MKKKQKRAKYKSWAKRRLGLDLDGCFGEIKGRLSSLEERFVFVEQMRKEQIDSRARANLRMEAEKKLYKTIFGNLRFVEGELKSDAEDGFKTSICRRVGYLLDQCGKVLASDGIRAIAPYAGDAVDPTEHKIVQTVHPRSGDIPGSVSECVEVGFAVRGVIQPAEVTVFANN